jgi:hypothetical protein
MVNDGHSMGRGIHNGGVPDHFNGQSIDFGYITNQSNTTTPYNWNNQADEDFYDTLRTVGTKFRWREDPDEIVYIVTGMGDITSTSSQQNGMHHTWHEQTSQGQGNNKFRFRIDFAREDGNPGGFGGGISGYHPIGGKDTTKVANREELGYWGGKMSTISTVYAGSDDTIINTGIPVPPGYGTLPNGFLPGTPGTTIASATNGDTVGELGVTALSVTKREMGCRWRQHPGKYHHIEILEGLEDSDADWSSKNPAIWETEPKEDVGMDIYYEASPALPIRVDFRTNEMFAPFGSKIVRWDGKSGVPGYPADNYILAWSGNSVQFTYPIDVGTSTGQRIGFMRPDGFVTYAIVNEGVDPVACITDPAPGPGTYHCAPSNYFTIRYADECPADDNWNSDGPHNQPVDLSWYNAFAYGNGIESDRIRDDYNQVTIANGVKASSVVATQYEEERRKTGLIHSGIYNSTSGINNLNQFIAAEKITKDMNPEYGSIQKLHTRDGDIVVMHEDKIMKVLADKNALYNADGSANVALAEKFLGSDRPFATKYGISTNPESFATDLHGRIYFADRARSAVLRLSGDGITNISNYGMKDWFNDHLGPHTGIILGSYDAKKSLYNISLEGYIAPEVSDESTIDDDVYDPNVSGGCGCAPDVVVEGDEGFDSSGDPVSDIQQPNLPGYTFFAETLSFSEQSKGWVSFKSFFPEWGLSINNEYYTWKAGDMYQHHLNDTRNYFYGNQYRSSIDILFNDSPEIVKSFTTLNYEGSQARVSQFTTISGYDDGEYFNLTPKDGWYIGSSTTNLQSSGELEFKDKEGKYFSYMKGVATTLANLDEQEFSVQGIGVLGNVAWGDPGDPNEPPVIEDPIDYCLEITPLTSCGEVLGCTDPYAINYDPSATIDDGNQCEYPEIPGCRDPLATNYDPTATVDDGSCIYCQVSGCMDDSPGNNPDINGFCADGVTNVGPNNYGGCSGIPGLGYQAMDFDPAACEDEGGCSYCVYGCTNPTALNYDPSATCDDGFCYYCNTSGCTDPYAYNYDPNACMDDGSCNYNCTYPAATSTDINNVTVSGGTDGQVLIEFPFMASETFPWNGPWLFDSQGNSFSIPGCVNNSPPCTNITSYGSILSAMSGSNYACNDPDVPCFVLIPNPAGTHWVLYMQGLPADTYNVTLTNNDPNLSPNGCEFQTTITVTEPMAVELTCQQAGFPDPSIVVADEIIDNFASIPATYSSNLYGHDMNYIPQTHAAWVLASCHNAGGYTTTDLYANGFVVAKNNGDLATMIGWSLQIGDPYSMQGTTKIPWDLAHAIDSTIPDSSGNTGTLLPLNITGNTPPADCIANCCTSDNYGGPLITHLNEFWVWDNANSTFWISEQYYTWGDFLAALNSLFYPGTSNPIFPIAGGFNPTLHDFFFVRNYITRWCGPCSINIVNMFQAEPTKCDGMGCTDPTAANYIPYATIDDGSCV